MSDYHEGKPADILTAQGWRVEVDEGHGYVNVVVPVPRNHRCHNDLFDVAEFSWDEDWEGDRENLIRLGTAIAALPDLLRALEEIHGFLLGQELTGRRGASLKFADIAQAAVAKAKGQGGGDE